MLCTRAGAGCDRQRALSSLPRPRSSARSCAPAPVSVSLSRRSRARKHDSIATHALCSPPLALTAAHIGPCVHEKRASERASNGDRERGGNQRAGISCNKPSVRSGWASGGAYMAMVVLKLSLIHI
eukprot:1983095-Rhodomonas_salina.2